MLQIWKTTSIIWFEATAIPSGYRADSSQPNAQLATMALSLCDVQKIVRFQCLQTPQSEPNHGHSE